MSDISETFPMDFQGAARSQETPAIIYISSDEDERIDSVDEDSVDDFYVSSDEESLDIKIMARCIERQLAEPIAIPSAPTLGAKAKCGTPKPDLPSYPAFTHQFFNLGVRNGPIERDDRVKFNHPISICRDLRPNIDTPMSPPPQDRGPAYVQEMPRCSYSSDTVSVESVANDFDGMALSGNSGLAGCSDCVVWGKSVQQIQGETVNGYLDKTVVPSETLAETERRKRAFLDGISTSTILLMLGGVSHATACNSNWYTIAYGYCRALPGKIALD